MGMQDREWYWDHARGKKPGPPVFGAGGRPPTDAQVHAAARYRKRSFRTPIVVLAAILLVTGVAAWKYFS